MMADWNFISIQDLAYTLRDGVVLCHIAAALDPASVNMKNVNQRPQVSNAKSWYLYNPPNWNMMMIIFIVILNLNQ